jgi:uncharacterized protein YndB with AHSA1/START domain
MVEKTANRMSLTLPSDREIKVVRVFDAPRSLVFEATSQCRHISRWWGPRGFEVTSCEIDFRPGGAYRFVQRAPDGSIHPFHCVYREITAPERVVFTQVYEPFAEHEVLVTNVLTESAGRTTITQNMLFDSPQARDGMVASGMEKGEAESFDRLDELLAALAVESPQLLLEREFDAPRDLVWKAWTELDRLAQWWGPAGFDLNPASLDLRPGGIFHYSITPPSGQPIWAKFVYREIVPQERLVFVNFFSDEKAGISRNPWLPTYPLEVLTTLTMTERAGKTMLKIHGAPINATAEEIETFRGGLDGIGKGFAGTFAALDRYLEKSLARA